MSYQIFNVWPHRGVFAAIGAGTTQHIRTVHLPTLGFSQLWTQVTLFSRPYDTNASVYIVPEVSNDGQNWEAQTGSQIGPVSTPGTAIKGLSKLGAFVRYDIKASAGLMPATLGMNLAITALGRSFEEPAQPGPTVDEMIAYMDSVERGFDDGPAPGGGRLLPFWPNDTALTSDDGSGAWRTIYTPAQPVQEMREVVAKLQVESFMGSPQSTLDIYPQFMSDGNWAEILDHFTQITIGTEFPFIEVKKFDAQGAYMRFSLNFRDLTPVAPSMGAKLEIMGVGR